MLNEKALEAATCCYSEGGCSGLDERERREVVSNIVAAYVSAILPEDAGLIVSALEKIEHESDDPDVAGASDRAASLIQSQAAREQALEDALEHVTELLVDTWHVIMSPTDDPEKEAAVITARALLTKDRQP